MKSSDAVNSQTPYAEPLHKPGPLHKPIAYAWLGGLLLGIPTASLTLSAIVYYTWERTQAETQAPILTTISERGQAGWSYVLFSFGMTLFAMLFLINGVFYALYLNSLGKSKWGFQRSCLMTGCTILFSILCSLGLWMLGTFSWAYHGGIQCERSENETNFELQYLHKVGVGLFTSSCMLFLMSISASIIALHRDGSLSWPWHCQLVAAVAFCGAALSLCMFMAEHFKENTKGVSIQMSISQHMLKLCMLVMMATLVIPFRSVCIQFVLVKNE